MAPNLHLAVSTGGVVNGNGNGKKKRRKLIIWGSVVAVMDKFRGVSIGVVVDCEGGSIVIPDYNGARILDKDGTEIKKFSGSSSHFANFIDAVRSRKPSDLHAEILEGHLSSALCHTGNIS